MYCKWILLFILINCLCLRFEWLINRAFLSKMRKSKFMVMDTKVNVLKDLHLLSNMRLYSFKLVSHA